jgi:integrase
MRGSIRKRGSRWCVIVNVENSAGETKQKWISGFRTRAEAEDGLAELLGKRLRGEPLDPDRTPLADYVARWLDGREEELAPLTLAQYRSALRCHIAGSEVGRMPIGKIRKAHLRSFEQELGRKLAPASCAVVHAVVSRALADAAVDDLISSNPAEGLRRSGSRSERRPKRFTVWTASELRALLAAAEGDRLEALWRLAVASGARRGELLGVRWLDFSGEAISFWQQVSPVRGGPAVADLKTRGSVRSVSLDAETCAALEAHRQAQLAEKAYAGDAYSDADLVFASELGAPIQPQRITAAFKKLREQAGIRPGRLHDVRHSHATHLLTRGIPAHVVAARLGHSSPVVTLSVYAHLLPTSDGQAASVLASVLAG